MFILVLDYPPTLSWLTINAMTASDKVIVIVSPGYFELDSIVQISKTIEEVKAYFNPDIELAGFLFTMSDPTINSKFFCSFFLMVKEAMAQAIR